MSQHLLYALGVFLMVALGILIARMYPVVAGAARKRDGPAQRALKWNARIAPLLKRRLGGQLRVATVQTLPASEGGWAVWSLLPTLIPDVEFIALARPSRQGDFADIEVRAVAEAETLRRLLGEAVQSQALWGHAAFLYVWPQEVDLDAVVEGLVPIETFAERHGLDVERLRRGGQPIR